MGTTSSTQLTSAQADKIDIDSFPGMFLPYSFFHKNYEKSCFRTFSEPSMFPFFEIAVSKANFMYHFCIGKGGFGKVWRVERKKERKLFALKEMSKARIITKRSVKSVMNERHILAGLNSPFLVNMHYAF